MLTSMGTALAQEGTSWYDRVSLMGYFQARYEAFEGPKDDEFMFRQMYLTLKADVTDDTSGLICLSRVGGEGPNIDLYFAYLEHKINDEWTLQVGQVPCWFGLEAWEGSSSRLVFERARILEGTTADGIVGFWWQGASDRGVWLRRNPTGSEPMIVLGACNGQFREADMNSHKNISLDIKWARDWGLFGASWLDGTFSQMVGDPAAKVTTDRSAVDAYIRYFPNPWGFQAEWADGELLGRDRDGYYLQGMYNTGTGTAFVRWEDYNAEAPAAVDAAQVGVGSEGYQALHLGYAWDLDPSNRITVEYIDADRTSGAVGERETVGDSYGGVQWQFSFR